MIQKVHLHNRFLYPHWPHYKTLVPDNPELRFLRSDNGNWLFLLEIAVAVSHQLGFVFMDLAFNLLDYQVD